MLVSTKMITGFNTDVRHGGRVYHVQTEDGGKDNPILESLVYVGGTVVAKKLTPYPEPLNDGAAQEALSSLLKRQHQVIIAAIKAGRIEDLIRHSLKQQAGKEIQENQPSGGLAPAQPAEVLNTGDLSKVPSRERAISELSPEQVSASNAPASISKAHQLASEHRSIKASEHRSIETAVSPAASPPSKPIWPSARNSGALKVGAPASPSRGDTAGLNLDQVLADYAKRGAGEARLDVEVLTPDVFIAGRGIGLRVLVTHDAKPDLDATVTVKIIGTAFKPQVFIVRVGRDGVASFNLTLPSFSTGTAAIVIEAQSGIGRGELKKLIRRA